MLHASWYAPVAITPWHVMSLGSKLPVLPGPVASAAYPVANQAIYVPFTLPMPVVAKRMFSANGSVASGNNDLGIYDFFGNRIVSIGSTAMSGTSTIQFYDITDTDLPPGNYYMALANSNATGAFLADTPTTGQLRAMGCFTQTSALALPSSATFAAVASAYLPLFGVEFRTVY